MPARPFPFRPHLDQFRNQAKDLLRAVRAEAPSALDDSREFHPERIDPAIAALPTRSSSSLAATGRPAGRSSPLPSRRSTPCRTTTSRRCARSPQRTRISPAAAIGRATAGTRHWRVPPTPRSDG